MCEENVGESRDGWGRGECIECKECRGECRECRGECIECRKCRDKCMEYRGEGKECIECRECRVCVLRVYSVEMSVWSVEVRLRSA